jgi:hypothetical protein
MRDFKVTVLWDVSPCSLVCTLKRWQTFTRLHGPTSQKTSSYSSPWELEISHMRNIRRRDSNLRSHRVDGWRQLTLLVPTFKESVLWDIGWTNSCWYGYLPVTVWRCWYSVLPTWRAFRAINMHTNWFLSHPPIQFKCNCRPRFISTPRAILVSLPAEAKPEWAPLKREEHTKDVHSDMKFVVSVIHRRLRGGAVVLYKFLGT